jgi:hypothetical protein
MSHVSLSPRVPTYEPCCAAPVPPRASMTSMSSAAMGMSSTTMPCARRWPGLRHVLDATPDANLKKSYSPALQELWRSTTAKWSTRTMHTTGTRVAHTSKHGLRPRKCCCRTRMTRACPPSRCAYPPPTVTGIGRPPRTAPRFPLSPMAGSPSTWAIRPRWWASKTPPRQCFWPRNTGEGANATSSPTST